MPVALRTLLIATLWVICGAGFFSRNEGPRPGFAVVPTHDKIGRLELKNPLTPRFDSAPVNPDQGLPMVHVASLAETSDGILHCVWYGGTAECHPDVKIYLAHKEQRARWTAPCAIMTREQAEHDLGRPVQALGNALLIANPDGTLRLLFVTIAMGKWSGSQLNTCLSKDGGLTWSRAERLTLSPFFNLSELVRNRPMPLLRGGWCVPIYQEFLGKFPELLWLEEHHYGLSYRKSRMAGGCTTFQPSVVPLDRATAVAVLRDYSDDRKVFRSLSEDGGATWSRPVPTSLPNPDAGVSGLLLSLSRILIAFNNSPLDRHELSLSVTGNGGLSWARPFAFEHEEEATFSYPFLMRTTDDSIGLAYTRKGREIRFVLFNEPWLENQLGPYPYKEP
jgi:hypothetical protein